MWSKGNTRVTQRTHTLTHMHAEGAAAPYSAHTRVHELKTMAVGALMSVAWSVGVVGGAGGVMCVHPSASHASEGGASSVENSKIRKGGASTINNQRGRAITITRGVQLDNADFESEVLWVLCVY